MIFLTETKCKILTVFFPLRFSIKGGGGTHIPPSTGKIRKILRLKKETNICVSDSIPFPVPMRIDRSETLLKIIEGLEDNQRFNMGPHQQIWCCSMPITISKYLGTVHAF